jgi:hypothetical protein
MAAMCTGLATQVVPYVAVPCSAYAAGDAEPRVVTSEDLRGAVSRTRCASARGHRGVPRKASPQALKSQDGHLGSSPSS